MGGMSNGICTGVLVVRMQWHPAPCVHQKHANASPVSMFVINTKCSCSKVYGRDCTAYRNEKILRRIFMQEKDKVCDGGSSDE